MRRLALNLIFQLATKGGGNKGGKVQTPSVPARQDSTTQGVLKFKIRQEILRNPYDLLGH